MSRQSFGFLFFNQKICAVTFGEYVVVRRLSEKELQKKIEKYRKRHLEIKRQLEKLEKKYRERDKFLICRGIDPFQYSFDLAERARMNAE